ncbi:cyclic nucleotide-binding domain-containing protein [Reinekea sp.]|uniref:cyclic nucleotide-binding domain-containing protein n=1 Tax=Reinekea sp. TaxID=1970455 RepID=UPI002A834383|nr:cyclic nucleotide-binding domain-containing protein [Reinekea sp.]
MKRTNQVSSPKLLILMAKIPFFLKFNGSERAQVAEFAQIFIADSGEAIIEKEARDTCFYVLLSGQGRVCVDRGSEPVAMIAPGEIFGEVGFILNSPRSTWVLANQVCALLRIDQLLMNSLDVSARDKIKDQIIFKLAKTIVAYNAKS